MARVQSARSVKLRKHTEAMMSMKFQWCVVAVPSTSWAKQVFPDLKPAEGVKRLWELVLRTVRADQPNPAAAWGEHDARLKRVSAYLAANRVSTIHFVDPTPAEDGAASTDLRVGLTDSSVWVAASSTTPNDVSFMANMPTEEVFTSPHRMKTEGWVRTSKPIFPLDREVRDAYFRFEAGECVEARAKQGNDALQSFLEIPGTRRLGEVALVDVRSPINQAGLTFFDTLFDENAACHIAFGKAYSEPVRGAEEMDEDARIAYGMNDSHAHEDFMIGTATMRVDGIRADGSIVPVMRDGMFVDAIYQ
jgi:aminopeptidase